MEYIRRSVENTVKKAGATFKAILVTGARQTGKSTLLKNLYPNRETLTFDDEFLEEQAKKNPEMFMDLHEAPITLDEVQYVPDLFRYIKIECDKDDERGKYFLSGSQPFELMSLATETLSGRIAVIEMSGLSLREIQGDEFNEPFVPTMDYIKLRKKSVKRPDGIWTIIHRGSYPELQNPEVDWQMFYSSYVKTYLERDVRKLSTVQNLDAFRRCMIACAARTGEMLNYTNIANEVGVSADTIKKWVSVLEASGIVYILEPYAASVLKKAIKTPKLYFRDTGLAAYLTRWLTPETLANGAMSGAFFETFVISEILKSYSNRGFDYRYFVSYYRGRDRKGSEEGEIDLIIEENGVLHPIEIKQASRVSADMTSAFSVLNGIPDKKRGMGAIVCQSSDVGAVRDDILVIPAWYI